MLLVALPLFSLTVWQYIEIYTQHRSRDPAGDDIVREIDDIRNGILLNVIAHRQFGKRFAFLMVRNALMLLKWSLMALISRHLTFAMSTTDVDPTDKPNRLAIAGSLQDLQSGCLLLLTIGPLIFSLTQSTLTVCCIAFPPRHWKVPSNSGNPPSTLERSQMQGKRVTRKSLIIESLTPRAGRNKVRNVRSALLHARTGRAVQIRSAATALTIS